MLDLNKQQNAKQQTSTTHHPCLVVIKDSPSTTTNDTDISAVFPPHKHENLHVTSIQQHSVTSPSSPLDFPCWDPPDPEPQSSDVLRRESCGGVSLFGVAVRVLKTRFFGFVSEFWCGNWGNGAVWAFGLGFFWWVFARRRRRVERVENLRRVVEENNKKIMQLLKQIAKMNELLLARHKVSVPKIHE